MEQSPLHNARRLSPIVKLALESLLGRPLKDNESISVHAYEPSEAPRDEVRAAVLRGLTDHFARIDEQPKDVARDEHEEAIEEALQNVRPGYRPIR